MASTAPLADRIRPARLDEFIGQEHLRERISALLSSPRLPSLLFFGPPGSGKSTLALLVATLSGRPFLRLSAPEVGLAGLRKQIAGIEILVLDELHRFSKAQQDFFLPLLESGEIVLLATTTENPSFSVTRQLLSRIHVLRLRALNSSELTAIGERGAKTMGENVPKETLEFLAETSGGDARTCLNLVEYVTALPADQRNVEHIRTLLPEIMIRGDRDGDIHYMTVSALIKSIRGSDPDAALYYLACMIEAGEDPRFICRRLILSASEDVGLGDPMALPLAVSCHVAVENIGMPEGYIPMAETVVYLALAPKSNTAYAAYLSARKEVRTHGPRPVPLHLRNAATAMQKKWGYGRGYKYPHAFPDAWIEQDYFPSEVLNRAFYKPKKAGMEERLNLWRTRLLRKRTKDRDA